MIKYGKIEMYPNQIIQICNWHKYQSEYKRQVPYRGRLQDEVTDKSDNERLQTERERDKKEIEKENKKEILNTGDQTNLDFHFEKWFKRYPRQEDKGKAKEKWLAIIEGDGEGPEILEDALSGYINWLHNQRITDLRYKNGENLPL